MLSKLITQLTVGYRIYLHDLTRTTERHQPAIARPTYRPTYRKVISTELIPRERYPGKYHVLAVADSILPNPKSIHRLWGARTAGRK
jgi:hypothetical protein